MTEPSSEIPKSEQERLRAEVGELRRRLEEAEQALEAIRKGEVESIVVHGPQGPRIFSLEGADHAYRVLVEAMSEGAATMGDDGTILYCNSRLAELLGAPLERIMGSPIGRFVPEHSKVAFEELVREARAGQSRREMELFTRDGRALPVFLSLSAIQEDEGRHRLCLVATDLRAQKRSEALVAAERQEAARLRGKEEERRLLAALVENLPELAWIALPDGHVDFYNRRWFEYTGTTLDEMQGWGWEKVHDPRTLPEVLARWKHSLATGEPFEMEFPLRGADGVFRWFLTRIQPLRDESGRVVRWIGSNTNVDEQRRTQARLAESLERLSRAQYE
ncbi:MAG: PAS domain-containing protein, partial [Polyangiaceae bacterium]